MAPIKQELKELSKAQRRVRETSLLRAIFDSGEAGYRILLQRRVRSKRCLRSWRRRFCDMFATTSVPHGSDSSMHLEIERKMKDMQTSQTSTSKAFHTL